MLGGSNVDAPDNNIVGRAGLRNPEGIEFGAESTWVGIHGENQAYGAYAIAEIPMETIAVPYVGYHTTIANDQEDGGFYGPIAGTIIEVRGIETVIEYQYLDFVGFMSDTSAPNDRHNLYAGLRFRF
jgi:hypothetical protein